MAELRVELHGELIGHLVPLSRGGFDFRATPEALRSHGLGSRVLSLAIPLAARPIASQRQIRANFFAELLPEGDALQRLALAARIDPSDVIGMLRVYGRDVAGAVQVWDPDAPGEPRAPRAEPVTDAEIAQMLEDIPFEPLGNRLPTGKTSLAGVQSKIVLARRPNGWARALDGYPSTHIVKPVVGRFPSMIFDEEYGSRFARGLGLAHFETMLESFAGNAALVIERYDRDGSGGRIHQEDFNQVLGVAAAGKYETYGGKGLADVAEHLEGAEQATLLKMVVLSVAIGNLDLHLKNLSVVHDREGGTTLAPMYDVVPQAHLPMDGEMGLFVNGVRAHADVTRRDLEAEGRRWGMRQPDLVVHQTLNQVREIAAVERPHPAAHPGVQEEVLRFTENLLAGLPAGGQEGARSQRRPGTRTEGGWGWDNPVA